jgi:HipA-like protein
MTNQLIALLDGREVGTVHHKNARLSFVYTDAWRADPNAYPLSLSDCGIGKDSQPISDWTRSGSSSVSEQWQPLFQIMQPQSEMNLRRKDCHT